MSQTPFKAVSHCISITDILLADSYGIPSLYIDESFQENVTCYWDMRLYSSEDCVDLEERSVIIYDDASLCNLI